MISKKSFLNLVRKKIKENKRRIVLLEENSKNLKIFIFKHDNIHKLYYYVNKKLTHTELLDIKDSKKNVDYTLNLCYRKYLLAPKVLNFEHFAYLYSKDKTKIPEKIEEESLSGTAYTMDISDDKITCTIYQQEKKRYEGYLFHGGIEAFNRLMERDVWL